MLAERSLPAASPPAAAAGGGHPAARPGAQRRPGERRARGMAAAAAAGEAVTPGPGGEGRARSRGCASARSPGREWSQRESVGKAARTSLRRSAGRSPVIPIAWRCPRLPF